MTVQLPFRADGLVVLIGYMLSCILVGALGYVKKLASKETSVQDHFLAGSGLSTPVLIGTLFAQTFSGWALFGYPAVAYRRGLVAFEWLPASIAIYVGALVVTPRLHRLGRPRRFLTTSDVLRARFGPGALHLLSTLAMLVPTFAYVTIQFKVLSVAIESMSGGRISQMGGAWISAVVMLAYDLLGGMQSVAWTDCMQAVLILGSFFLLIALTIQMFGGTASACEQMAVRSPWRTQTLNGEQKAEHYSTFILMLCFSLYPHQATRVYAARSAKGLRQTYAVLSLMPFLAQGLCLVLGWAATPYMDAHGLPLSEADDLLFVLMRELMEGSVRGYWLSVFLMGSAIAAMMSTADSGLMAISAMVTNDLAAAYGPPSMRSPSFELMLSKLSSVVACVVIVIASQLDVSIVGLAALQQQVLTQTLPAIWLSLHVRSLDESALLSGLVAGLFVTILILVGANDPGYLVRGVHPGTIGLLVNFALVALVAGARYLVSTRAPAPPPTVGISLSSTSATATEPKALEAAAECPTGDGVPSAAGPKAAEEVLFGAAAPAPAPAQLREPMRLLAPTATIVALSVMTCSFWRKPGEQDPVWISLPGWAELQLIFTVLLALATAAAFYLFWELEEDFEPNSKRKHARRGFGKWTEYRPEV